MNDLTPSQIIAYFFVALLTFPFIFVFDLLNKRKRKLTLSERIFAQRIAENSK